MADLVPMTPQRLTAFAALTSFLDANAPDVEFLNLVEADPDPARVACELVGIIGHLFNEMAESNGFDSGTELWADLRTRGLQRDGE